MHVDHCFVQELADLEISYAAERLCFDPLGEVAVTVRRKTFCPGAIRNFLSISMPPLFEGPW